MTGDTTALYTEAEFSLYPNPANEFIYLTISFLFELKSVKVLNARGATTGRGTGNDQLNVSSLAAGPYLLRACASQNTFVKRFAKQ